MNEQEKERLIQKALDEGLSLIKSTAHNLTIIHKNHIRIIAFDDTNVELISYKKAIKKVLEDE